MNINLVRCTDIACISPVKTIIESGGAYYLEFALDSHDLSAIAYQDTLNQTIILARCNDIFCTNPIKTTVDTNAVGPIAFALDHNDLAVMGYTDVTNDHLTLTRCIDFFCKNIVKTIIGNDRDSLRGLSIDSNNLAVIFYDSSRYYKSARCNDISCSIPMVGNVSHFTLPATGAQNFILDSNDFVTFIEWQCHPLDDLIPRFVKIVRCHDITCSNQSISGRLAEESCPWSQIAILVNNNDLATTGYPISVGIEIVRCKDIACKDFSNFTIQAESSPTFAMNIDNNDFDVTVYHDASKNASLKLANCPRIEKSIPNTNYKTTLLISIAFSVSSCSCVVVCYFLKRSKKAPSTPKKKLGNEICKALKSTASLVEGQGASLSYDTMTMIPSGPNTKLESENLGKKSNKGSDGILVSEDDKKQKCSEGDINHTKLF